jgi:hypothetical protein
MYAPALPPDAMHVRATIPGSRRAPAMSIPPPKPASADPPARPASLWDVVRTVFWSFLGVRRSDAMRRDVVSIRPHQVVIVGVVLAALFVLTLLTIVRIVISNVT